MKAHRSLLSVLLVIFSVFFVWQYVYATSFPDNIGQWSNSGEYKVYLLDGVTADGSGTAYDCGSLHEQIFHISINSGTATITPQWQYDTATATWSDGNAITASGIYAYPVMAADTVRATVSSCAACDVDVVFYGYRR